MAEGLPHVIRPIDGAIRIPYPIPPVIKCGLCLAKRGGTWRTHERVRLARAHFRNAHTVEGVTPEFTFFCGACLFEGDTLHKVGRHKCGDTPRPLELKKKKKLQKRERRAVDKDGTAGR